MSGSPPRSSLVVIVRDEARSLLEWIVYHRLLGFSEIVVYDNESRDGTTELCRTLADRGIIKHVVWPDPPAHSGQGPQVPAYEHAAEQATTDWLCFLDADEFLVLRDYARVVDLLRVAGRPSMPIALNWKVFGSSGEVRYRDDLVIERFVRAAGPDEDVNRHIKTIGPVSALRAGARVHVHGWVLGPGQHHVDALGRPVEVEGCTFVTPPVWEGAWVNHYIVKSREEFEQKRLRGGVFYAQQDPEKYGRLNESYFSSYDLNEHADHTIRRFAPLIKHTIARWRI